MSCAFQDQMERVLGDRDLSESSILGCSSIKITQRKSGFYPFSSIIVHQEAIQEESSSSLSSSVSMSSSPSSTPTMTSKLKSISSCIEAHMAAKDSNKEVLKHFYVIFPGYDQAKQLSGSFDNHSGKNTITN